MPGLWARYSAAVAFLAIVSRPTTCPAEGLPSQSCSRASGADGREETEDVTALIQEQMRFLGNKQAHVIAGVEVLAGEDAGFTAEDLAAAKEFCKEREGRQLFMAIFSAPTSLMRRELTRKVWLNAFNKADLGDCIQAKFFIGHDYLRIAAQGKLAAEDQMLIESKMKAEDDSYGDIVRIAMSELPTSQPDKAFLALNYGLDRNYSFVAKMNDDQVPSLAKIVAAIKSADPMSFLYVGAYLWDQQFYPKQAGAANQFHKYFNGKFYLLSSALAEQIAVKDLDHTAKFVSYGSIAEDVDMGHWVYRAEVSTGKKVSYLLQKDLCAKLCVQRCPLD